MVGQTLSGGKQPRVTHRGVGFFAFLIVFAVAYFGELNKLQDTYNRRPDFYANLYSCRTV